MSAAPNLFDATTRQHMADLYGTRSAQIQRASNNAAELDDTFNPAARAFLRQFAHEQRMFTAEDVTRAAALVGLVAPCHGPWGSIFRDAARSGVIRRIDYLPRRNSNPAPLYESLAYMEAKQA
jgi:hypothetical protein